MNNQYSKLRCLNRSQLGLRHHHRMTADRPNRTLSADVELALLLVDLVGAHLAAKFLTRRGADFALTCRVLGEPAHRRVGARTSEPAEPAPRDHPQSA